MQYMDIVTPAQGIFNYMGREFPQLTNQQLDLLFFSKYAKRTMSPLMEVTLNLNEDGHSPSEEEWYTLALLVKGIYDSKWTRFEEINSYKYGIDEVYKDIHTNTIENLSDATGKSSQLEKSGVYGFDNETEVPTQDKDNNKSSETSNHHDSKQTNEYVRHGNIGANASSPIQVTIEAERRLRRDLYICEVLKDVADTLTLQIYE